MLSCENSLGYLVVVMGCTWLLRGLRGSYGAHVPLFFAKIVLFGSYRPDLCWSVAVALVIHYWHKMGYTIAFVLKIWQFVNGHDVLCLNHYSKFIVTLYLSFCFVLYNNASLLISWQGNITNYWDKSNTWKKIGTTDKTTSSYFNVTKNTHSISITPLVKQTIFRAAIFCLSHPIIWMSSTLVWFELSNQFILYLDFEDFKC